MKIGKYILIPNEKYQEMDMENRTLKVENENLEKMRTQLLRDIKVLHQLLDIEQQNTRMSK